MKRFALAGNPNCGKTTLFKVICDELDYDKGEICKEIKEYSPNVEVYSVGFTGERYCLEKCS